MVTIGVAEDQALVRESLAIVLNLEADLKVIWTAGNGREAVDHAKQTPANVILMDLRMPELDGVSATREILMRQSSTKVIVLTTFHHDEWLIEALGAGATACFLKEIPPQMLISGLRMVDSGTWETKSLNNDWRQYVPDIQFPLSEDARRTLLSAREIAVLRRICHGETNSEIADAMHLSHGTVKNYVSNLYAKLNARHRAEAVATAHRLGIR